MLAESYPWWLFIVFVAAFAIGWRLIGWLYDRFVPGNQRHQSAQQPQNQGERPKIDPGEKEN
jgi:hypothetical protein